MTRRTIVQCVRQLCAIALVACLAVATPAVAETTPSLTEEVTTAYWWGDFDTLDRLYAQARRSNVRNADGKTAVQQFRAGLAQVYAAKDSYLSAYYDQLDALTLKWAREHPTSALAQLMYARALYAHAWHYRGGAFASKVPEQAWAPFKKAITAGIEHLGSTSAVVSSDTTTHIYLLMLGRSAGWPKEQLQAVANAGLAIDPDEEGIYEELLISMMPKWGGSAAAMRAVVNDAVNRTRERRGMELYATVYAILADDHEAEFFAKSGLAVDWEKMKQGYRDLLSRHPSDSNLNEFARMACLAQDKPTAQELLAKIGAQPVFRSWGSGSDQKRNFELCMRWVGDPSAEPVREAPSPPAALRPGA